MHTVTLLPLVDQRKVITTSETHHTFSIAYCIYRSAHGTTSVVKKLNIINSNTHKKACQEVVHLSMWDVM